MAAKMGAANEVKGSPETTAAGVSNPYSKRSKVRRRQPLSVLIVPSAKVS